LPFRIKEALGSFNADLDEVGVGSKADHLTKAAQEVIAASV